MAEESGKGIALVILGIVAIIAIVGLVLLFTGAKKAAVGEFAVPGAKEYGGAVRGVYDPISRSFSGRASDNPNLVNTFNDGSWYQATDYDPYSSLGQTAAGQGIQKVAPVVYGETGTAKTSFVESTYGRNYASTPSAQTACDGIVRYNADPSDDMFSTGRSANDVSARGWTVVTDGRIVDGQGQTVGSTLERLRNIQYQVNGWALDDILTAYHATGTFACTIDPQLGGLA